MGWLYQWTTTWHDAWDVVGAVATAAAVIVAVWGVRRESRARKLAEARADAAEQARVAERERVDRGRADQDAARREQDRRAQALQVIAWLEAVAVSHVITDTEGRRLPTMLRFHYVNHSSSPLFDVTLRVFASGFNEFVDVAQVPVVPGGVRETAPVPRRVQQEQARGYGAVVDFRDLHGVHWRRTQDGKLFELDEHGNLK